MCILDMMRYILISLICFLTLACTPTPRKVTEAIGRGEISEAVELLSQLLNSDEMIPQKKFERVLEALGRSRKFNLDHADQLFQSVNDDAKPAILAWYSQQYLGFAELKLREADLLLDTYRKSEKHLLTPQQLQAQGSELFEDARQIWRRYQHIRKTHFPGLVEPTPVLGIIDLRETEFLVKIKAYSKAEQKMTQARRRLTSKVPFDRVRQPVFKRLIQNLQRQLKERKP